MHGAAESLPGGVPARGRALPRVLPARVPGGQHRRLFMTRGGGFAFCRLLLPLPGVWGLVICWGWWQLGDTGGMGRRKRDGASLVALWSWGGEWVTEGAVGEDSHQQLARSGETERNAPKEGPDSVSLELSPEGRRWGQLWGGQWPQSRGENLRSGWRRAQTLFLSGFLQEERS